MTRRARSEDERPRTRTRRDRRGRPPPAPPPPSLAAGRRAGASTLTISSAASPQLGKQVAVNPQGRTLYTLSGESRTHQICTSAECLKFWPPLRVSSRSTKLKAGSGVHGKLGIISRSAAASR